MAGLLGEVSATLPLVDRSSQVVSRQTLQRGPEPAGRPDPPHFLAGTGCVAESGNWQLRGSEGRSSATNGRVQPAAASDSDFRKRAIGGSACNALFCLFLRKTSYFNCHRSLFALRTRE